MEFSDEEVFLSCTSLSDLSPSGFLEEVLKNTHTCTHTHTCSLPGPDREHTHTCFHTHTQLFTPAAGDLPPEEASTANHLLPPTAAAAAAAAAKARPVGNREAVRKYREKKKAHAAYLEEQVAHLRLLNQQLLRKVQSQAGLEAEIARLRSLLSEFRGRIDRELGGDPGRPLCCVGADGGACSLPRDDLGGAPSACRCSLGAPCAPQLPPQPAPTPCADADSGGHACKRAGERRRTFKVGHANRDARGSASRKASGSTVAD